MPLRRPPAAALLIIGLAPLLAGGAHCTENCGPPALLRGVSPHLEAMLTGPAVVTARRRVEPLARWLSGYELRALHLDVSRPTAVLLTRAASDDLPAIQTAHPLKLDRHASVGKSPVIAVIERAGTVPLFPDAASLAEAEREGYDTIVLVPRDTGGAQWGAAVKLEVGMRAEQANDPIHGQCIGPRVSMPSVELVMTEIPARCGDGVPQAGEECDDGNRVAGDGCGPFCVKEQ